ncbi:MAG: septum site-determining protein MinC [Butyrivibrio sp.]|nr:septum site-determining protein MinC [Butyrivibrio sp.]
MENSVTIKGTKSGIILVLDENCPYEELKTDIASKFAEAASFLGSKSMGLIIRGRALTDDETKEVTELIENNSQLRINCVIDEESAYEKLFISTKEAETVPEAIPATQQNLAVNVNDAEIFHGNLRSGQDIMCEKSVILLGDVKPGANITSYGSIFILGELRGNAFAGAGGDRNCVVMALDLNPIQIRIADAIAISPDAEKGPKLKTRRKKLLSSDKEPEIAYIENDKIFKTCYGASFIREFYKNQ